MSEDVVNELGEALDDLALMQTGRSYGVLASSRIAEQLLADGGVVQRLIAEAYGQGRGDEAAGLPLPGVAR